MFTTGQIVYSKCGRDQGRAFVVFSSDEAYAYLVDGDLRPVAKPKKKKAKHIQPTGYVDAGIQNKIKNNLNLQDAEVRKVLTAYTG